MKHISYGLKSETKHLKNDLKSKNLQLTVDPYPAIRIRKIKNDLAELKLRFEQTFEKLRESKMKYQENTDGAEEVWYEAVEDLNEDEKCEGIKINPTNLKEKLQPSLRKHMGLDTEHSTEKEDANLEMLESNGIPESLIEETKFNTELITEMEECIEEFDKKETTCTTQSENHSRTDSRQEETQLDTEMNLNETEAETKLRHDEERKNKDTEETTSKTQGSVLGKTVEEQEEETPSITQGSVLDKTVEEQEEETPSITQGSVLDKTVEEQEEETTSKTQGSVLGKTLEEQEEETPSKTQGLILNKTAEEEKEGVMKVSTDNVGQF